MMKVLHYIPSMARNLGGVATYLSILSGELGQRCELVVVTSAQKNDLPVRNCRVVDIEGFSFTDAGLSLSWGGIKRFTALCGRILDEEKPDVVHINGIWSLDRWLMQREALRRGIRTYIMPHGMLEPWILHRHYWTRKLPALILYERKALQSAVCLIATAESERKNLERLKANKAEVPVVANGIDVSQIPMKTSWTKRKKILYVSRIHVKKGIELLLDVAADLRELLEGYDIIIAGEGEPEYVETLKRKARESRLSVQFVGGVYGAEKWRTFQEADFFVLPTNSENFGYVIAESLACGTPVITTHGAPWADIEGRCGFWIERTEEELRKAMTTMMRKKPEELERMGREGRRLIEEQYSATNMAEGLMGIYNGEEG